jgi:hypothetical protein
MMTRILMAAAAVLFSTGIASAQTVTPTPAGPSNTGTTRDTRKIDQAQAPVGAGTHAATPSTGTTSNTDTTSPQNSGHWRTSDGFNNDPNNPSGAPK